MALQNVNVHNAEGVYSVVCTYHRILHEYQHPFIILFNNIFILDISNIQQYYGILVCYVLDVICIY